MLYVVPVVGLAVTHSWWATLLLWPLAGLATAGLFVVGHDASHGALLESRRANRIVAQLCMVPSAHAEAAWDLGHNRIHHGYTTRQGFDFVWHPLTVAEYQGLGRIARWRHRVEWSFVGSGAAYLRTVWWKKMWRSSPAGARHDAIVRDKRVLGAVIVVGMAGSSVLAGVGGDWTSAVWMPVELFVVPFLLFVHIIGWTVCVHHVSPEIRWWPRRDWTQFRGQMESTTILRVPRIANALWFHNIFVHVPHHVDARIPFHRLPRAAAAIVAAHPDTVRSSQWSWREYRRTTRLCKLYDFEAGTWVPYPEVGPTVPS